MTAIDPRKAMEDTAIYVRGVFPTATHLHVRHSPEDDTVTVAEVYDRTGVILKDVEQNEELWEPIRDHLALLFPTHATRASHRAGDCYEIMLPTGAGGPAPTLRTLEHLLSQVVGEPGKSENTYMWEASSKTAGLVGAGLLPLSPGVNHRAAAGRLRALLAELSGDTELSVWVSPWDHDGSDYSRAGFAGPADDDQDDLEQDKPEDEYNAVLVPADPSRPCERITLPAGTTAVLQELGRLVGGSPQAGYYDRDAAVWVEGNSANDSSAAPNVRLTRYVWGHSEASSRHAGIDPSNPPYWLFGDAVLTGRDGEQGPCDAPNRLFTHFRVEG